MTTALEYAADLIDPPSDTWEPLPHQIAPAGRWYAWMLLGGRGAGKTAAAARHLHEHIHGPPCMPGVPGGHWPAIIAPTLGDGVTSCVNGPSGLRTHCPELKVVQRPGGTMVIWPNGTEAKLFGAHTPEDVERLRSGGNRCIVWAEELAAWRYIQECWNHMRYGLRLGPWPHVVISTTPKPKQLIKKLVKDSILPNPDVVITKASTLENPFLDRKVKDALVEDYGGTREGRQELYAEVLEDVPGALFDYDNLDLYRLDIANMPEWMSRIAVGVDPAMSTGGDETGIIVAGVLNPFQYDGAPRETTDRRHGFVMGDYSLQGSPATWARQCLAAWNDWEANIMVPEINNGGELVAYTIHTLDPTIAIAGKDGKGVHASRGKAQRAEPISMLYQQGLVHHIGELPELEEQMVTWDSLEPDDSWSPDRMDAMVWALTELMVRPKQLMRTRTRDTRLVGRR